MLSTLPPPPLRSSLPPPPRRPPRSRRRFWVLAAGLALTVAGFVSSVLGFEPGGALILFAIMAPIERRWRRHQFPMLRPGLRADLVHVLTGQFLSIAFAIIPVVLVVVAISPLPTLTDSVAGLPPFPRAVLALLWFELLVYGAHRLLHEVPFFWRFHRIHHSSTRLDWVSGFRTHPAELALVLPLLIAPAVLMGFDETMIGGFVIVQNLSGLFLHANVRWRLRFLDGRLANPEFHHWHHSNHPEARNTNYSAFLPLWDRVFGTYYLPASERPHIYGVDGDVPASWWGQFREPFRGLRWRRPPRQPVPF